MTEEAILMAKLFRLRYLFDTESLPDIGPPIFIGKDIPPEERLALVIKSGRRGKKIIEAKRDQCKDWYNAIQAENIINYDILNRIGIELESLEREIAKYDELIKEKENITIEEYIKEPVSK